MFWNWWKKQNSSDVICLDIGPESIKLLKIDTAQDPYYIQNLQVAPTPSGAVAKNQLIDYTAIANTLKNMLKQSGTKTKSAAFAIPYGTAIIKTITLDNRLTANEIEARAWIEANRHFPDLVGDIYLDFVILGPSTQDTSQIEAMLVACRKDQIKPYLEICKLAGLTPKRVDISSHSLEQILRKMLRLQPEIKTAAILNLDVSLSTLVVIEKESLLYAHDQTFDGHRLLEQAKEYTQDLENQLKETVNTHVRHAMHFLYASRPNIKIDHVIISGDCAALPSLSSIVQQEIGIPTTIANPFENWISAKKIDEEKLKRNVPAFALCSGLALAETINLLPWREQVRKENKLRFMAMLGASVGVTVIFALLINLYFGNILANQEHNNDYLQAELSQENATLTALKAKKNLQDSLLKNINFLFSLRDSGYRATRLLDQLAKITPDTVVLTEVRNEKNSIIVRGKAESNLQITVFMDDIAKSPYFHKPILTAVSETDEGERDFELMFQQT